MHFCMEAQPSREATSCGLILSLLRKWGESSPSFPFQDFLSSAGGRKNSDPFTTAYLLLGSIESMCWDGFTNVLGALKNKTRKKERPARFVKGISQTVKLTWRCLHPPTGLTLEQICVGHKKPGPFLIPWPENTLSRARSWIKSWYCQGWKENSWLWWVLAAYQGSRFNSQHPFCSSPPSVTPVQVEPTPFFTSTSRRHTCFT